MSGEQMCRRFGVEKFKIPTLSRKKRETRMRHLHLFKRMQSGER